MIFQGKFTSLNGIQMLPHRKPIFEAHEKVVAFDVENTLLDQISKPGRPDTFKLNLQSQTAINYLVDKGYKIVLWSSTETPINHLLDLSRPRLRVDQTIAGYVVNSEDEPSKDLGILSPNPMEMTVGIEDDFTEKMFPDPILFFKPHERTVLVKSPRDLMRAVCEADKKLSNSTYCSDCLPRERCRYGFCPRQLR